MTGAFSARSLAFRALALPPHGLPHIGIRLGILPCDLIIGRAGFNPRAQRIQTHAKFQQRFRRAAGIWKLVGQIEIMLGGVCITLMALRKDRSATRRSGSIIRWKAF